MKHSNPTMRKPSLGRVNFDLGITKLNANDPNWYIITCPNCEHSWRFQLKEIPNKVTKCPSCGWEEVFFQSNYVWETYEEQSPAGKEQLKMIFGTDKVAKPVDVEAK